MLGELPAVGWRPTGFGGCIICMLATYRVWRLHYLHVGRTSRAVGWQPTGFGGCILCMLGELVGL